MGLILDLLFIYQINTVYDAFLLFFLDRVWENLLLFTRKEKGFPIKTFNELSASMFFFTVKNLFLFFVFAFLVSYCARCFASALARCLTFAATAFTSALFESCFGKCFNKFHDIYLL